MERTSRTATWILVLALAGAGVSRARSQEERERRTELDVLRSLGLPQMVVKMTVKRGRPLAVEVKLSDREKRPAANRKLTLRWKGGSEELETDEAGAATFEVSAEMLPRPVLLVPEGYRAKFSTPGMKISTGTGTRGWGRVHGMDGKERPLEFEAHTLDLDSLKRLEVDGIEVYYPEGKQDLALEVMAYLARVHGFIRGMSGLELATPYGLALHDKGVFSNVSVMGRVVFPLAISAWKGEGVSAKDMKRLFGDMGAMQGVVASSSGTNVHWVPIHEWVEGTLIGPGLYMEDKRTRFVGDGLAELLSYEYCRRYHPGDVRSRLQQYIRRAQSLLASGQDRYDLGESFHAHTETRVQREGPGDSKAPEPDRWRDWRPSPKEAAGYPMSFWFWHRVLEQGGPDAIRKLVAWLMLDENPDRNLQGVLKRVEAVAGSKPAIVVDVAEAKRGFQRLLERTR